MALVSLRQVLDHAAEHGYGVPAFNVNNLEQIQAIMEAAEDTQSPVILRRPLGRASTPASPIFDTWSSPRSKPIPAFRSCYIRTTAPHRRSASSRSAPASRVS